MFEVRVDIGLGLDILREVLVDSLSVLRWQISKNKISCEGADVVS